MHWPHLPGMWLATTLASGTLALAEPEEAMAQAPRWNNEAAVLAGVWLGDDIGRLGFFSGPTTPPTTFLVSYSEGDDLLIGIRYTRLLNSWFGVEGMAALASPVWTVTAVGFADSAGLAQFLREPVSTRVFAGRVLFSPPGTATSLSPFVAIGLGAVWYAPGGLLKSLSVGNPIAPLSALDLRARVAPGFAAGVRFMPSKRLALRIEAGVWLPQLRDQVSGDRYSPRSLSFLASSGIVF